MDESHGKRGWYQSRGLPHRDDLGLFQSITLRLADSFPKSLIDHLGTLNPEEKRDPKTRKRVERVLDEGHGARWLANQAVAEVLVRAIHHLDQKGSSVFAYVVMPNHVHFLFQPRQDASLGDLLRNLKGFTARESNKILQRSGSFWAEDYFDRFIRDTAHFYACRRYIHMNPVKAQLCSAPEEWPWSSAFDSHRDEE